MSDNEEIISDEVLRFIDQRIDTVPHLEALLLMWESAPKAWTEAELAARIYVDSNASKKILRDLERRKFIARLDADQRTYIYDSSSKAAESIPLLAQAYRRQLVAITRRIHSKASLAVREFSRAFQFKRDD